MIDLIEELYDLTVPPLLNLIGDFLEPIAETIAELLDLE